jgi:hypothetical protein
MQRSPQYEFLQVRLGRDLSAYVQEARAAGRAWRTIAADLSAITGVTVSYETVRVWFAEPATPVEAAS